MKKMMIPVMLVVLLFAVSACGTSTPIPLDYGDAASFEADLNGGENLVGKTVAFTATELVPQSVFGYNIYAGEHLNFVSSENPDVSVGDTVTVKVTDVRSLLGSWIISYEKVSAQADAKTITS